MALVPVVVPCTRRWQRDINAGTDSDSFDDRQYHALAGVIRQLKLAYPAISNNMAGHSDIAPGRKTDPGTGFDWQHLQQLLE